MSGMNGWMVSTLMFFTLAPLRHIPPSSRFRRVTKTDLRPHSEETDLIPYMVVLSRTRSTHLTCDVEKFRSHAKFHSTLCLLIFCYDDDNDDLIQVSICDDDDDDDNDDVDDWLI